MFIKIVKQIDPNSIFLKNKKNSGGGRDGKGERKIFNQKMI